MQIEIKNDHTLDSGTYTLIKSHKLQKAQQTSAGGGERELLIQYDRFGGQVKLNGEVLPPSYLWKKETKIWEKPVKDWSINELELVLNRGYDGGVPTKLIDSVKRELSVRSEAAASSINLVQNVKDFSGFYAHAGGDISFDGNLKVNENSTISMDAGADLNVGKKARINQRKRAGKPGGFWMGIFASVIGGIVLILISIALFVIFGRDFSDPSTWSL